MKTGILSILGAVNIHTKLQWQRWAKIHISKTYPLYLHALISYLKPELPFLSSSSTPPHSCPALLTVSLEKGVEEQVPTFSSLIPAFPITSFRDFNRFSTCTPRIFLTKCLPTELMNYGPKLLGRKPENHTALTRSFMFLNHHCQQLPDIIRAFCIKPKGDDGEGGAGCLPLSHCSWPC